MKRERDSRTGHRPPCRQRETVGQDTDLHVDRERERETVGQDTDLLSV